MTPRKTSKAHATAKPEAGKAAQPHCSRKQEDFPPEVMNIARQNGKTPLRYWYEGTTLAILWADFSKDRYAITE